VKDFLTNSVNLVPEEITIFQKKIHAIFEKYKTAISKYCAYSNIESVKFLMTYGSKKTLVTWNYFDGSVDYCQFKTKGEMVQAINNFKVFYESCNAGTVENTFTQNNTISGENV
jgi:hypothetical protein